MCGKIYPLCLSLMFLVLTSCVTTRSQGKEVNTERGCGRITSRDTPEYPAETAWFWQVFPDLPLEQQLFWLDRIAAKIDLDANTFEALATLIEHFSECLASESDQVMAAIHEEGTCERLKRDLYIESLRILIHHIDVIETPHRVDGLIYSTLVTYDRYEYTGYDVLLSTMFLLKRGHEVPESAKAKLLQSRDWRIEALMKEIELNP